MTKYKKELLKKIMTYVSGEHHINEIAIDKELDRLIDDLKIRIENGEFDLTIEELKDIKAEWIREE